MDRTYSKTSAGRQVLRHRDDALSRTARNLLFVLDSTRSAQDWILRVQGATEADLRELERRGYIEPGASRGTLPAFRDTHPSPLADSGPIPLEPLTYSVLYERLTSAGKEQLGLMKGFKFVLEVEKCTDVRELEVLARRLVEEIRVAKGLSEAVKLQRALGLLGTVIA